MDRVCRQNAKCVDIRRERRPTRRSQTIRRVYLACDIVKPVAVFSNVFLFAVRRRHRSTAVLPSSRRRRFPAEFMGEKWAQIKVCECDHVHVGQ